jgi:hypothetical protein
MKIDKSLLNIRKLQVSELDVYMEYYQYVKDHMEHPEWLGDFTREAFEKLITTNSVIMVWTFLSPTQPLTEIDEFIAAGMLIPARQKDLDSFLQTDLNVKDVIDFGPEMVHPDYIGNGLQSDVIQYLEKVSIWMGYKVGLGTVHPDNIYSWRNLLKNGFDEVARVDLKRGLRNVYRKELKEDD